MKEKTESPTLILSRDFDASPEQVVDAWVTEAWCEWTGPAGSQCRIISLDARRGGSFRIAMSLPDGRKVEHFGIYREFTRPAKLQFTWAAEHLPGEMLITVTFESLQQKTRMTLEQTGFADADWRDRYHGGWAGEGGSFDKLAARLARAKT